MQKLDHGLHICDLMWEKLDHSLVTSHLTKPVNYLEKVRDVFGDCVGSRLYLLLDVVLKEPHYWRDELIKYRVQYSWLLLIFFQL